KFDTFRFQYPDPSSDDRFFQFEIGNAIAQQPSRLIISFKYGNRMSGFIELGCCGQSGRAATHNRNFLARSDHRGLWSHKSSLERFFSDAFFDMLNRYSGLIDTQYASRFTGGRTNPPGKLGKVVGAGQNLIGFLPVTPVYRIVEVRNDIPQRTAIVTEWDTAIHAARCLIYCFLFRKIQNKFSVML